MLQLWAARWHSWLMQASRFGWSSHYNESMLLTPCFCKNALLFWPFYCFPHELLPSAFQWWSSMWCASTETSRSSSGSWREAWMGPSLLLLEKATEWMWAGLHGASVAWASFIQNHLNVTFPFISDWPDWRNGELGSKKPHIWWPHEGQACVERRLLHPQILFWCSVWLSTLAWLQQKNI